MARPKVCPMEAIEKGTLIEVTDALGRTFRKRAVSPIEDEGSFPVVWACSEDEWASAVNEGREPEAEPFPWPARSLRVLEVEHA